MVQDAALPTISLVIPSLNYDRFLDETLDSVWRQNYLRLEVVVMDGGSSDDSVDVIRRHADRLAYWQSLADGGQSRAVNEGVRHCRGDLVGWLNADDLLWSGALWTVARAYAAHPGCGVYTGNGYRLRPEGYSPWRVGAPGFDREALVQGVNYVLQPATFYTRRAWDEVGGLDEELNYCMDWDLIVRVAALHPVTVIDDCLAVNREHADSKTQRGGLARAAEIVAMTRRHSGRDMTPGALLYLLETLIGESADAPAKVRWHLVRTLRSVREELARAHGRADGAPVRLDPQDHIYRPEHSAVMPAAGAAAALAGGSGTRRTRGYLAWAAAEAAFRQSRYAPMLAHLARAVVLDPGLLWKRLRAPLRRRLQLLQLWIAAGVRR